MSRINELAEILKKASQDYYENGSSDLSDQQYDVFYNELKSLDPSNEIFRTCGKGYSVSDDEKEKFKHPIEVGSIDKYRDLDEVISKLDQNATFALKLDGNSTVDYFEYGVLQNIVTRGSDNIGIIRTKRFVECDKVPNKIDFLKERRLVAVRGEVVLPKSKYTTENGFNIEKASRNAVAGAISRKTDYQEVLKHVDSVKYTFIDCDTGENLYDYDWSKYYPVESQKPVFANGVPVTLEYLKHLVENSQYECDGIVFRNSETGELFAFKFEDEFAETEVLNLEIEIGTAQRLTPVAALDPVNLSGSLISRASLGSMSVAKLLGLFPLKKNNRVKVVRSGEIIPVITEVISSGDEVVLSEIRCPVCDSLAQFNGAHMFCVNPECPNIEHEYLYKFCNLIAPEGLKEKTLEKVFDYFDIHSVLDLVLFDDEVDFSQIPGIGSDKVELIDMLFDAMYNPINSKVIYKTFLNGCGERASRAIVNSGFKFENYVNGTGEFSNLESLSNFNSNIIQELHDKLEMISNACEILEIYDEVETVGDKKFCITGVRLNEEQKQKAKNAGWEEKSGVSKNLDILVVKDVNSNSEKSKKAKSLGVKVVSLNDFLKMIG